jgi:hypothetical protein
MDRANRCGVCHGVSGTVAIYGGRCGDCFAAEMTRRSRSQSADRLRAAMTAPAAPLMLSRVRGAL